MVEFDTEIDEHEGIFHFECYDNDHPIDIGDKYLFFFGREAFVAECQSEQEKYEINPNDREQERFKIDMVTGFWKNCFKIKETDLDLGSIES